MHKFKIYKMVTIHLNLF